MKAVSLLYLFKTFLKIGATSWGGHMALISMVQRELVDKRQIIKDQDVVEGLSLGAILPGPMAVNIVSFLGFKMRGWKGAFVCVFGVLIPAFLAILILSFLYFKYTKLIVFKAFFAGIISGIAAIIASTGISMVKKNISNVNQWILLVVAFVIFIFTKGYWVSLIVIISGGVIGRLLYYKNKSKDIRTKLTPSFSWVKQFIFIVLGFLLVYIVETQRIKDLILQFGFISITQVGGGYVVIPSMEKIFVDSLHWVSHQEFIDGIALSQITPGPIFIIATFLGYKTNGIWGSIVATVSVFLPSAILMIYASSIYHTIKKSLLLKAIFMGIKPVVIGMILASAINILIGGNTSIISYLIFILSLFLLLKTKIATPLLIVGLGLLGIILYK